MVSKSVARSAFSKLRHILSILVLLSVTCTAVRLVAVTNVFLPVADTSLLEVAPANNLGGYAGMNAGTTQEYKRTRALLRFDLTSLPTNTVIVSAQLEIEVTHQPNEPPTNATFGLHRMLRAWGEGDKSPVGQTAGKGLPATAGEATWNSAFHPTNNWTVPGGAPDVDFSSIESASQFIYGVGDSPYHFETTPELVADLTSWVHQPASNFGWMLLCDDEASNFTARRFCTREDSNAVPLLTVEYLTPPQIKSARQVGNEFELQFTAVAGQTYVVEYCTALTVGTWQTLTNLGSFTNISSVQVLDDLSLPLRFYRLDTY